MMLIVMCSTVNELIQSGRSYHHESRWSICSQTQMMPNIKIDVSKIEIEIYDTECPAKTHLVDEMYGM
jgi:hypothetical protein